MLTRLYRLIWGDDLILLFDPYYEYGDDYTFVGHDMNSYETNIRNNITSKIDELHLIYNK